jgi:hypothetical protein
LNCSTVRTTDLTELMQIDCNSAEER